MSWNYRVVKEVFRKEHKSYSVHEVYYDGSGRPNGVTSLDVSPGGEDANEFLKSLALWNTAIEKPVLIFDNEKNVFVGEEPPLESPLCPDCGRPMTRREPWVCANCGEECEL